MQGRGFEELSGMKRRKAAGKSGDWKRGIWYALNPEHAECFKLLNCFIVITQCVAISDKQQ